MEVRGLLLGHEFEQFCEGQDVELYPERGLRPGWRRASDAAPRLAQPPSGVAPGTDPAAQSLNLCFPKEVADPRPGWNLEPFHDVPTGDSEPPPRAQRGQPSGLVGPRR